jgi:hypothetical protein
MLQQKTVIAHLVLDTNHSFTLSVAAASEQSLAPAATDKVNE